MGTEIENDLLLFEEDEPVKPEVTNYEADLSIFDDIETENKQIQQEIVASNIQDAPDNLDLYNEIQSIAERTGYDTDMISENLSTMRKQVQLQDLDFPKFQTEYPQTASFLSDRRNSLLTADNVDNLAYHEKLLGDSKRRIDMSRRNSEMIPYIKKIGGGEATAEDYAELEKLEGMNYQDSQVDYDLGWFSEVIPISAEFGDQMIRLAPISIAGAAVGAGVGATAGFFSPVPGGAAMGARTGARIGASAGMGTEIAEMEGWLAYNDYRKMTDEYGVPVSDGYAKGSAIIVGIANGGIELVKVEALISMFPGAKKILGSLVESVGKGKKDKLADAMNIPGLRTVIESVGKLGLIAAISGGEEATQELVTSTGKDVVALGSENYVRTDTMSEKMTAAGEAFSVGARGGAGLGTVPVIGSHVMHNKKVRYTQARAGKIGELMGIAQDSKLRQRDPATYKEHIKNISSQDGERKNVYIAPEKVEELFQSIDPVILEEQMPGILERIEIADEHGQDVSIPLEEFMTYVAPADEAMPYIGEFKFGRDEATLNEIGQESAKLAKIDESMKQYTDLLQSEEVAMQSAQDRQVYEAIKDKLLATGESDTVASYQAEVINAFAVARAQEFKNDPNMPDISPYDLAFGDTTLNVQREGIEQPKGETREEGILNLLREGGPTDKEIFGQSLNEFLAQKGLDVTSDLEAMDAGKTKYGGRRLMRKGGMSIDEAIDMSIAQGYFPDAGGTMHPTDFMEAVWDGENVYAAGAEDQSLLDIRNEMEALESEMDIEGLDWMNMTNAEVIEKMPSLQQAIDSDESLYVSHNVSAEGLYEIDNLGGMAAPSLAILDSKNDAMTGYGDITLLADKEILSSGKMRTFNADVYSPRQPRADINPDMDAMREYREGLSEIAQSLYKVYPDDFSGRDSLGYDTGVQYAYLESVGGVPKSWPKTKGLKLTQNILKKIRQKKHAEGLDAYITDLSNDFTKGKQIFKGFTPSGNRKYAPYTLDNVVREMVGNIRGGEGYNYGAGSVRAKYAKELKSIAQIRKAKEQLVSKKDFEQVKEESSDRLNEVLGQMEQYYKFSTNSFGYMNDASEAIGEGPRGWNEAFNMDADARKILTEYTAELEAMPTEYFEVKAQRAVDLSEFDTAIVPTGTPKKALEILKKKGIKVKKYKAGDEAARIDAIRGQEDILFQEKRGSMRSGESKKWFTITLGGKADYSTFLHEGMHFTVAMMDKLAAMENVPQSIIDENNKMRAWAGAKPGEKMTVAQEEKLAEAFEKYLKEGKAPSAKLKEAFRRFSMWLTQIYKTLKESDVVLDDEIRGVFDRLLATQEEITAAKEADNLIPMFESAADMGVSDKAFAAYVESWNGAERAGKEEIDRKVLEEYYHTKTSEYKKKRQAVKKKIELELSKNKHWNALSFIRRGKFLGTRINDSEFSSTRLNSAEMKSDYVGTDNAKRLSRLKLTSPKGMPAQRLADYLGYESADALVQQMLSLPKYEDELNYRTDIAMKEKYGDVLQDTPEIASEAMNNDEAGYALAVELAALSKLDVNVEKRGHFQEMRALKAHAERIISEHKFTQLRPGQYRTAEVRMSSASAKAKAEGKDKEAAEYKRKQIMNHYLYMETNRAKVEISKIRDHLARYQKVTVRDKVGKVQGEYLEQIMSLLERVNLRKSETGKSIEKKKSLAAWLDEQEAADNVVNVPESIRNAVELTSYKDMTFSELIALDDAVSSIENIVRTKDSIMVAQQKRKLEEVLDEITNNADNHLKQRKGHKYVNMPTTPEKLSDAVENAAAEGVKMEQIALWIDGGKPGIAYDTLYDPLNVAMYNELEMKRDVGKKVQKLMLAIPAEQRRRLNNGIYKFQGGITVKGIDILSVALNWGNLSNRKKLIEGYRAEGWTEEHVFAILDKTLEKEDWAFVQGVWNELGVIGDEGLALARKTQGKAPPKIKAEKFVTRHGIIDGGYYPIAYDPNAKNNGYKADQFKKEGDLFAENFLRVGISHGFAEGRAEDYSAPIRLSLSVMNKHIDDVIHYITHYEAITGINKVISNRRFERMIKDKFGTKHYQALQEILNNVATNSDNLTGASFLSNDTLKWMRGTITATTFGFNLSSTAMQTLGLIPAMTKVKPHYLAGSLLKYATLAGAPKEWKFANDNSKILKHSITTWDQNVYAVMESSMDDASRNLLKKLGKHGQRYMFTFVGGMQRAVSGATWTAKYKEEMNEHNDHDAAVKAADSIVTTTQGGGSPKDLSPIQIGDGYKKQFTSFMGYFMVQALMLREVYRRQAGKNITEKNRITMIPETVAKTALILSIPTLVEMIMRGETPDDLGDEDDRNDWLRQYGINNILLALNVPLVGSMASYVLDGKYGYTYNPTSSTLERLGREFKTVFGEDKEFDERAYSLAVLVGFRYKLPTTELKRLYKVWEKYQDEGELDDTARELIFGINYD